MRILFVATCSPMPPMNGVNIPVRALLKRLSEQHDVIFATFAAVDSEVVACELGVEVVLLPQATMLERQIRMVPRGIAPYFSEKAKRVLNRINSDIVIGHRLHCAYVTSEHTASRRLIVQDVISAKVEQYSSANQFLTKVVKSWYHKVEAHYFPFFERLYVVSNSEAEILNRHVLTADCEVVVAPNGVEVWPQIKPLAKCSATIGYFGRLDSNRNRAALERLIDLIRHSDLIDMGLCLRVVGGGGSDQLRTDLSIESWIEYVGESDSPEKELADVIAIVNPQQVASGMKNSVIEPMSGGLVAIVSPPISDGLGTTHKENIIVADSDVEFVCAISETLQNSGLLAKVGLAGRQFIINRFSWCRYARLLLEGAT